MTTIPLNDFKAAVADGLTARQIAERFNVSPTAVRLRAQYHNLTLTKAIRGPRHGWAGVDYKRVVELREQGWTYQEIGDEFGVTRERIRQILHAEGRSDLCGRGCGGAV